MKPDVAPTTTSFVAIEPVVFTKVESKVEGGFARIAQKVEVMKVSLVMNFKQEFGSTSLDYYGDRHSVLLRSDSGLAAWNKTVLEYEGVKFVMCPISAVLGFV